VKRESWLAAAPESAATARAIVREAAGEQGLDEGAVWDLMLATTEAVTNAVLHGRGCAETGAIRLEVQASEDGLFVEVCDCGRFSGRREPREPVPQDSLGGRGIPLMSAVTDDFELLPETGGTRVRFGKRDAAAAA
jgi:anti-sigma regulatory factor (Ser/Thr protein kinase)